MHNFFNIDFTFIDLINLKKIVLFYNYLSILNITFGQIENIYYFYKKK